MGLADAGYALGHMPMFQVAAPWPPKVGVQGFLCTRGYVCVPCSLPLEFGIWMVMRLCCVSGGLQLRRVQDARVALGLGAMSLCFRRRLSMVGDRAGMVTMRWAHEPAHQNLCLIFIKLTAAWLCVHCCGCSRWRSGMRPSCPPSRKSL